MNASKSDFTGIDCQAIFDANRDATFILNSAGKILDANQTAVNRYGYSLTELKQMDVSSLATPTLQEKIPDKLKASLKSGEIFEWKHLCKNGKELPVEIYTQPITLQGEPLILSRVRDITGRKELEAALQNKTHLLERILDTEPGIVYVYDLINKKNIYINRHWLPTFGYTVEEIQDIGSELINIFHPDDFPKIAAYHEKWREIMDEEARIIEYRIRNKQGGWYWLISREIPFAHDENGRISQILGIAHDITSRKLAEILLAEQNQVMEMIAAGKPLPDILTALIHFIENHADEMLGTVLLLDEDGTHVRHGAAPNMPAEFIAAIDGQAIGACAGSCGTAAYRKEAVYVEDIATDPLWVDFKAAALPHGLRACWSTPIFDEHQNVLGTFAMYYRQPRLPRPEHLQLIQTATHIAAIAISHHKKEAVLQSNEARYRLLFQYAPNGIVILDAQDHYRDANVRACTMLGYTRQELIGLHAAKIVSPAQIHHVEPTLETIKSKVDHFHEWQLLRKDGSVFPAEVIATAMPDGNVLGIIRDITERKLAETKVQRLTQLYAALSQCNQAIVRCNHEMELFPQICRDAVRFGGMQMAWIGMVDAISQRVEPVASFGAGLEYLNGIEISTEANNPAGLGPVGSAIRNQQPCWIQDFQHDPSTTAWHARSAKFGWGAAAALPLYRKGVVIGTFTLYTHEKNSFDESAQKLLIEMATDISFALDRFASERERDQAEQALRVSEHHLRTIIETEPECVKVVDRNGQLIDINAAGLAMLEVDSLASAVQHNLLAFILPEYRDAFNALHQRVMSGEKATLEFELTGLKGTRRWLETNAAPLRNAKGEIASLLGITRDITERKNNEERIKYLANFDSLTGLPNRTQLDSHLKYALNLARRSNGHLALMFIDLDRFKDINDTLGHSIGDTFLVEIARRLRIILRDEDTASRLGGDEFILMLPGNDAQGAAQVAQKLLDTISQPCRVEQYDLAVTASIGIALYPDDGNSLESLSKSADTAMYRAKLEGRNSYRFFTPEMQAHAMRNMQLIHALRGALEHNQFQVHYQPQVSIHNGHVIGVEALLRWQHPEFGNVSPAEFIPIAEDCGLILPIGEWVLRTAVKQLKHWMDNGLPSMVVAVNLSAVQFRHPSLPELVSDILSKAQLPSAHLELELTEGVAMHDPQGAIEIMNNLHERGIRMSIDDFGTGYSSLNYLKKFKVYKLKIDQSFVRDINTDQEDKAIVAAIISMASNLGLKTIAEGVESGEQLDYLHAQGCNEAQGYYFSRPLPAEQIAAFILAQKHH